MAKTVEAHSIGVDVSKATVEAADSAGQRAQIENKPVEIRRWLKGLPAGSRIAVEATNTFHCYLVEQAHALGHVVYLVDGYRLNRYREGVGKRAKTDASDAQLLLRYLLKEGDELRPWEPPPAAYTEIQRLLQRRRVLTEARVKIEQSLRGMPALRTASTSVCRRIAEVQRLIDKRLREAVRSAGWGDEVRRCQAIEGIGELNATALTQRFHRGAFSGADAFIAFLGLDVRVRDSGKLRGRRKLTKKGDPELRRLLYNAAMAARKKATWQPFYNACLARGLTPIQALVALARKLARVAFALLKNHTTYLPGGPKGDCAPT